MKTISILNLKGGVAKTFTAANMAYELYRRGYKVLLIDNDKQGNLSKAYSRYDAENVAPVTRLLAGDWENADELIQHTEYEGIDIVTANMSLFGATWNLTKEDSENQIERYKALVYAKMQYYGDCTIYGKYDYCIIDNPPDIGLNVVNALAITDEVIVPVKVDEDALEGLDIVTEQIEDAKVFNPALKLAGVLITSYQNTDGEAASVAHKERLCVYWHCRRTGGTECWNWGSKFAGKKCPKSDACEHWRTCEMCNGVMGQCKKKQRIEKAR